MKQDDGSVTLLLGTTNDQGCHAARRGTPEPIFGLDIPSHVPVAEFPEQFDTARVVGRGAEWEAHPGPWIGLDMLLDGSLRLLDIRAKSCDREEVHMRVVM